VFTLTFAGFVSGLLIVGAFQITLPRITANKAAALHRAVFEVVPGSSQLERLVMSGDKLVPSETGDPAIYAAYDSTGAFKGYAIPSEGAGFQDVIKLIYGYLPTTRHIVGMAVLESRETPGLGDRIFKDKDFHDNFKDLAVEPKVELVKGTGTEPNQVDAITGATISSRAVVGIVNAGNAEWLSKLPPPGEEPPLQKSAAGASADAAGGGH
jgi:H+/Na+-translocating ferredoxin:NAD+ oxidoreductase subunit G